MFGLKAYCPTCKQDVEYKSEMSAGKYISYFLLFIVVLAIVAGLLELLLKSLGIANAGMISVIIASIGGSFIATLGNKHVCVNCGTRVEKRPTNK